ncbi:MAG: hypothetical protein IJ774_02575 [Selenomonadaceae bacterium]|nr:hypothetical protein [Selenomonadaceae bacterium]
MVEVTANFSDEIFSLMSILASKRGLSVQEYLPRKMDEVFEDEEDILDAQAILADEDDEIISHEEFWRGLKS